MQLNEAKKLARSLMDKHKLFDRGWGFEFDRAVKRFGCCNYRTKTISLSQHLVQLNDEQQVTDTVLHEIAHALVGSGQGHNRVWQRKAIEIGCNGQRCYDVATVNRPKLPYKLVCPTCGITTHRARKPSPTLACGRCCAGKYNAKHIFTITKEV